MNGAARPFLPGWPAQSQLDLFHDQAEPGSRFTQGVVAPHHGSLFGLSHPHPYSVHHQSMLPPLSGPGDTLHKVNEYLSHRPASYSGSGYDSLGSLTNSFAHGSFDYGAQKHAFSQLQDQFPQQKPDPAGSVSIAGTYMPQNITKDVHHTIKEHSDELKVNGHPALPSASTLMSGSQQPATFQHHGIDRFISHANEGSSTSANIGTLNHDKQTVPHTKSDAPNLSNFVHSNEASHPSGFVDNYSFPRQPVSKNNTSFGVPAPPSISSEYASMPPTSAISSAAATKQSVISYYSNSNESERPNFPVDLFGSQDRYQSQENAIKVAEKIIQEAHCTMKNPNSVEKRPSSSLSNPYKMDRQPFQQNQNGMWHNIMFSNLPAKTDYSIDKLSQGESHQKNVGSQKQQSMSSSRPSSVKSGHSLDIKSPVDFRPENFPQNWTPGHLSRPESNKSGHSLDLKSPVDFVTDQFVQNWHNMHFAAGGMGYQDPGRNAALDMKQPHQQTQEPSHATEAEQTQGFSSAPAPGLPSQPEFPPPYDASHQKVPTVKKPGSQSSGASKKIVDGVKKSGEGSKKKTKKNSDLMDYNSIVNKPAKRGSTMVPSDNPIINNLVDEKVQQIMAAYRQKEQSTTQDSQKQDTIAGNSEDKPNENIAEQFQAEATQLLESASKNQSPGINAVNTVQTGAPLIEQNTKIGENLSSQIVEMRHNKTLEHHHSLQQDQHLFSNNPPSYQDTLMMKTNQQNNVQYAVPYPIQNNKQKVDNVDRTHNTHSTNFNVRPEDAKWEKKTQLISNEERPTCCSVCSKHGKFSENCQNHKHPNQAIKMHESVQKFHTGSRLLPFVKNEFNKDGCHAERQFMGHHMSGQLQGDVKPQLDPFAFTDDMDKQFMLPRKKPISNDFSMRKQEPLYDEKPFPVMNGEDKLQVNHGTKNVMSKKLGIKTAGVKPTLPFFKKSYKYHTQKLKPFKKKPVSAVPNGKVKKNSSKGVNTEDAEFTAQLIKNLGFPPLTRKELLTRKNIKIPGHITKGPATIASSVLSTETKGELRDAVPSAEVSLPTTNDSSKHSLDVTAVTSTAEQDSVNSSAHAVNKQTDCVKHTPRKEGTEKIPQFQMRRSRSTAELFTCDFEKVRKRSRSVSLPRREEVDCTCKIKEEPEESEEKMSSITSQINNLQSMMVGEEGHGHLLNNSMAEAPNCGCLGPNVLSQESIEGPYYTHLGTGRSVEAVRKIIEGRTGVTGSAIRIEKVRYTGKEGKSSQGCPIAKWIIRRSSYDEKYLTVVRHRQGHFCDTAWIVIAIVAWEGVKEDQANELYDFLCQTLPMSGYETERRCGTNDSKMCACQGADLAKRGASFSFGCSWSMYFNGCKFARSQVARKFKLKDTSIEPVLESKLQNLASFVGPLYGKCAPEAHNNQCYYSKDAHDCRLGPADQKGPFSGVTACVDFCAHAHKDIHNMNNGSTVVVTLTKHRGLSKPDDEQLHVLPMYVLEPTDESGSYDTQYEKIQKGSLEVLHHYPLEARIRSHPLTPCKKRRELARKARKLNGIGSRPSSNSSAQSTPKKMKSELQYVDSSGSQFQQFGGRSMNNVPGDKHQQVPRPDMFSSEHPVSYEELMSCSAQAGFSDMYDRYWQYFYANGVFPPSSVLNGSFKRQKSMNDEHSQFNKAAHSKDKSNIQKADMTLQPVSEQQLREKQIQHRQQQLQMHKWQQQQHEQQHDQQQQQQHNLSSQQGPVQHHQHQQHWYPQHQHVLARQSPQSQHVQFRSHSVPLEQSKMAAKMTEQIPQTVSLSQQTSACVQGSSSFGSSWSQLPQTHPTKNGSTGSTADNIQARNTSSLAASSSPQNSAMDLSRPSSSCNTSASTSFTSGTNCVPTSLLSRPHSTSSSNSVQLNLHVNTQDSVATDSSSMGKAPLDMLSQVIAKRSMDMGFNNAPHGNVYDASSQPQNNVDLTHSQAFKVGSSTNQPHNDFHQDQVRGEGQGHLSGNRFSLFGQGQGHVPTNSNTERNQNPNTTLSLSGNSNSSQSQSYNIGSGEISKPVVSHNDGVNRIKTEPGIHNIAGDTCSAKQNSEIFPANKLSEHTSDSKFPVSSHEHQNSAHNNAVNQKPNEINTDQKAQSYGHNIHPAFGRAIEVNRLYPNPRAPSPFVQRNNNPHQPFRPYEQVQRPQSASLSGHVEHVPSQHEGNTKETMPAPAHGPPVTQMHSHPSNYHMAQNAHQSQQMLQHRHGQNNPFSLHSQILEQRHAQVSLEKQRQIGSHDDIKPVLNEQSRQQYQNSQSFEQQNNGHVTPQNQQNFGRVTPQNHGRVTPQSQQNFGRLTPQNHGRVTPQNQQNFGRVTPQNYDRVTPQNQQNFGRVTPQNYDRVTPQNQQNFGRVTPQNHDRVTPQNQQNFGRVTPQNQDRITPQNQQNFGRVTPQNHDRVTPQGLPKQEKVQNIQQNVSNAPFNLPHSGHLHQDAAKHGTPSNQVHPKIENFHDQFGPTGAPSGSPTKPDPDVVKCQMEYNVDAFQDPNIGGVAISLSHGAVLFEVAKRELHATTGLRNPNRYRPTRISLVFYQHKNLNRERHGMYAYAKKLEDMKKARMEKMQMEKGYVDMTMIENSFKGGKKRKLEDGDNVVDEEAFFKEYVSETAMQYRYLWDCTAKRDNSFTTDSVSMNWISPKPMVTGPYQKWI